jgi:hypothetical protein
MLSITATAINDDMIATTMVSPETRRRRARKPIDADVIPALSLFTIADHSPRQECPEAPPQKSGDAEN